MPPGPPGYDTPVNLLNADGSFNQTATGGPFCMMFCFTDSPPEPNMCGSDPRLTCQPIPPGPATPINNGVCTWQT